MKSQGHGVTVSEPVSRSPERPARPLWLDGKDTRLALLAEIDRRRSRAAQLEGDTQQSVSPQSRGATAQVLFRARRETLKALEDYSNALSLRGWPTPPKMVREIQLLRSLLGITRPGPNR
jgi:hypothetical protein